jgi:hypothetical protein
MFAIGFEAPFGAASVHDGEWTLEELLDVEPGPAAMAMLCSIDPDRRDTEDKLLILRAWERQAAWLTARQHAAMCEVAGPEALIHDDPVRDEVAAALGLSRQAADNRIHVARTLADTLSGTRELLEAGQISTRHAMVMVDECGALDKPTAENIERRVLANAPHQTAAAFRRSVRRAVDRERAAPAAAALAAHEREKSQRRVVIVPEPDGMATLIATMPALDARRLFDAVDTLARARHAKAGGRRRDPGIDARRVDALIALADGALADRRLPAARRRKVELQVVIDLPTLLGLREDPAHLPGHGPLPAALARQLAEDAEWRRLVVDPVDGHLLDYGSRTSRPPQKLRDYIVARDRTCRFPGCGQPARRCDLDHVKPARRGKTSADNMIPLCRHHHRLKTHHHWQVTLNPDSSVVWRSPAGREYHLKPRSQLDD